MKPTDYTTTFLTNASPEQVFKAVNNPRGWWSEEIEGTTDAPNAAFDYHYLDVHVCKMRIVEFIPNQKVVWLVLENHFKFTKDQSEWVGNKIFFDISEVGNQTQLHFTQQGLTPEYECYDICNDAWTTYIQGSLKSLIETGKGAPNSREKAQTETEKQLGKS